MPWISDRPAMPRRLRALDAAGIPAFGQGEMLALPGLDVVGLTDIDTNGSTQTDLLTPALLDRLGRPDADRGRSWPSSIGAANTSPSRRRAREMLADADAAALGLGDRRRTSACGERAASRPLGGGDVAEFYSLGNFLFDQTADARRQARCSKCASSSRARSSARYPAAEFLRHGQRLIQARAALIRTVR